MDISMTKMTLQQWWMPCVAALLLASGTSAAIAASSVAPSDSAGPCVIIALPVSGALALSLESIQDSIWTSVEGLLAFWRSGAREKSSAGVDAFDQKTLRRWKNGTEVKSLLLPAGDDAGGTGGERYRFLWVRSGRRGWFFHLGTLATTGRDYSVRVLDVRKVQVLFQSAGVVQFWVEVNEEIVSLERKIGPDSVSSSRPLESAMGQERMFSTEVDCLYKSVFGFAFRLDPSHGLMPLALHIPVIEQKFENGKSVSKTQIDVDFPSSDSMNVTKRTGAVSHEQICWVGMHRFR